mmetsp:Transcript_58020/g.154985  ORF Transcript_58020/g.154985 Transcript_58020/m.154985 type:complete len:222 (-) Transcript_58020:874-1539(-)
MSRACRVHLRSKKGDSGSRFRSQPRLSMALAKSGYPPRTTNTFRGDSTWLRRFHSLRLRTPMFRVLDILFTHVAIDWLVACSLALRAFFMVGDSSRFSVSWASGVEEAASVSRASAAAPSTGFASGAFSMLTALPTGLDALRRDDCAARCDGEGSLVAAGAGASASGAAVAVGEALQSVEVVELGSSAAVVPSSLSVPDSDSQSESWEARLWLSPAASASS